MGQIQIHGPFGMFLPTLSLYCEPSSNQRKGKLTQIGHALAFAIFFTKVMMETDIMLPDLEPRPPPNPKVLGRDAFWPLMSLLWVCKSWKRLLPRTCLT